MTHSKAAASALIITIILLNSGCSSIFRSMKDKRDRNYREGLVLYKHKNYHEAQKKFKIVVSIDPEYGRARTYLKRSALYLKRQERYQQRREEKKQRTLTRKYHTALAYMKKRKYETALNLLLAIQRTEPEFEDIDDQIDECRDKLSWKYDRLIRTSEKLMDTGQYKEAYATLNKTRKYDPNGREARSLRKELEKILNTYYKRGLRYYGQEKFRSAIREWNKVIMIDPNHTKARQYKERAEANLQIKRSLGS